MAAISPRITYPEKGVIQVQWPLVTENDTFAAANVGSRHTDRAVTLQGTIGGATILVKGSYDGTNYHTLTGTTGSASFAAAGQTALIEATPYLQCTHSGGSSESMTVTVRLTAVR